MKRICLLAAVVFFVTISSASATLIGDMVTLDLTSTIYEFDGTDDGVENFLPTFNGTAVVNGGVGAVEFEVRIRTILELILEGTLFIDLDTFPQLPLDINRITFFQVGSPFTNVGQFNLTLSDLNDPDGVIDGISQSPDNDPLVFNSAFVESLLTPNSIQIAHPVASDVFSAPSDFTNIYNLSVTPNVTTTGTGVPEPATLALFGIGLFGIRVLRRNRGKAKDVSLGT